MTDDDELDEYVEEPPEPARGTQRLLIIILSVGCLALAISNVVLAMRVTQLRRAAVAERPVGAAAPAPSAAVAPAPNINEVPAAPPPTTKSAAAPPPAPADAEVAATPPPAVERRVAPRKQVTERAVAPARGASEPPAPAREASEPPAPAASIAAPPPAVSEPARRPTADVARPTPAPARAELPPRDGVRPREQARVAAVTRTTDRVVASTPLTPERATATWMVQEYGRGDAETRARAVADFYGAHSPDGAYWRRVLAEIARR